MIKALLKEVAKQNKHRVGQGLATRLMLLFTLVSLVPLLVLGTFSFFIDANIYTENSVKYTADLIKEININLFLRFSKIDDISKALLNNTTLKDILAKEDAAAAGDYWEDSPQINQILKSIMFSNDYIKSIYILPEKNTNTYAVGMVDNGYEASMFTDEFKARYKDSDLYKETLLEYNSYKWWPSRNIMGKNVLVLTRKLYDVERGNLGVIVILIGENMIDDMYGRINKERGLSILLTDEKGVIIYHPDKKQIGQNIDKSTHDIIYGAENGNFDAYYEGEKQLGVFDTFFITGWKFTALTPYSQLHVGANRIRNTTLIIAAICILLVFFISLFVTRTILKPLRKLRQLMKKGASGDLQVRFTMNLQDEIGDLGESFNSMMASIQNLMHMLDKESKLKVDAQIKSLEAQINPHFLYNTLASIYWNATSKGNTEIADMSLSLSNFFKLGLNKGKEFTTVSKEVEHAREYLSIQKMLYEDRFDLEIDIHDDIREYKVIKLIIQPLVENSLVHGLEDMDERGLIRIEAFKAKDRIVFKVLDNGKGLEGLVERGLQSIIDGGYGIKNLQERLRLYFHNDFTIACTSIPGVETVFEITVPAVTGEGDETSV